MRTPDDILHALVEPGTVLLETTRPESGKGRGVSYLFSAPHTVLQANHPNEISRLLRDLERATSAGYWVAGAFAYEAAEGIEPLREEAGEQERPVGPARPLAWFGLYEAPEAMSSDVLERVWANAPAGHLQGLRFGIGRDAYRAKLAQVKHHIREGDVYQINVTDRFGFEVAGSPLGIYARLRQRQRVGYGGVLRLGTATLLSLSPELFVRQHGRQLWTRPMKGTIRRGQSADEDAALQAALANDPKNRAENLMIVDLLRNDLSVCCEPGSVQVPALFETEVYETVVQMTSTVTGRLRPGAGFATWMQALFPCGSITGAPKIRAREIIRGLEGPRGWYCGAIGYAAPDDRAVFNVAIRTLVIEDEARGTMGVGSGVVWDSDAEAEYDECLLKGRFLLGALADDVWLIETMRAEHGSIALFAAHRDRLAASADHLGYAFDPAAFEAAVQNALRTVSGAPFAKVRVTLARDGQHDVQAMPTEAPQPFRRVALAAPALDARDPLRYHKTTERGVYERVYAAALEAGYDEALFLNERGEVAEGTRTNVFVRLGGRLLTPPLQAGVLPGVYRQHVLATHPEAAEAVLHADDLAAAERVYLCNAVVGLQPVEMLDVSVRIAPSVDSEGGAVHLGDAIHEPPRHA